MKSENRSHIEIRGTAGVIDKNGKPVIIGTVVGITMPEQKEGVTVDKTEEVKQVVEECYPCPKCHTKYDTWGEATRCLHSHCNSNMMKITQGLEYDRASYGRGDPVVPTRIVVQVEHGGAVRTVSYRLEGDYPSVVPL